MLDFSFEVPACHLSQRKPAPKLVGRNILFPFTDLVSDVKSFTDWEFNAMEYSSIGSSFFGFTFRTAARKRFLPGTRVRITTFLAHKTIGPFDPCQKFQTFIVIPEHFLQLFRTKAIAEYFAHKSISLCANVNNLVILKRFK
jgi:hypothetical protein